MEVPGMLCEARTEETAEIGIDGEFDANADEPGPEDAAAEFEESTVNGAEILTGATIDATLETTETLGAEEICAGEDKAMDSGLEEIGTEENCPELNTTCKEEIGKLDKATEILAGAEVNDTI